MRLGGWQRVGIVLSVAWMLGAGYYQRTADIERAANVASAAYDVCDFANSHLGDKRDCSLESKQSFDLQLEGSWGNVAIISFVPIPLAWLAIYLAVKIWWWIRKGFKTS